MSDIKRVAVPSGIAFDEETQPGGTVDVTGRADLEASDIWAGAFRTLRKDRRYFELIEDTVCPEFTYRYFTIKDEQGRTRAVQPYFLLDQDLLTGVGQRWLNLAAKVRRVWPGFLKMRTLMVGCAAGEGHLHATASGSQHRDAEILAANIVSAARRQRASLIVMKEFPARYRDALACFLPRGFARISEHADDAPRPNRL